MSTIVYAYGAHPPVENPKIVREQMWLAHRYQNKLVEIELARREDRNATMRELAPRLADLDNEIASLDAEREAVRATVRAARQASRTKVAADAASTARIREIGAALKALRAEHRETRRLVREDEEAQKRLESVDDVATQKCKDARAVCGVYWGTYLLAEAAMQAARKEMTPPKFHRWTNEGAVAVQLQGGMSVAELLSCTDSRLRLEVWEPTTPPTSKRGQRRRYATLWIRVGSEGARTPIWSKVPIVLHRPLPLNVTIKWAKVILTRVGLSDRWSAQFTIEVPNYEAPRREGDAIGVDVGWRSMDHGLRVAMAGDEELVLPQTLLEAFARTERIRAERDTLFNVALFRTANWMRQNAERLTEAMAESLKTMHAWKSPARLAALAIRWRDARIEGDDEVFSTLEFWRKRDAHLYQYEAHLRDQAIARRRDIYRVWSSRLCNRYATIVLEKFDLREVAVLGPVEKENALHQAARRQRVIACISELRSCLRHAASKVGTEIREIDPASTTSACSTCGTESSFDRIALKWRCGKCGTEWDQDVNAAINIKRRGADLVLTS